MPDVRHGRFVTFEGIDGSGKSTALKQVCLNLRAEGIDVTATREESDGPTGDWVRRSISEGWPALTTAFLFAADRASHLEQVRASQRAGRHVLCDRFVHSTYAYQGATLATVVPDAGAFLRALHEPWCPSPDRVILFTLDPQEAVRRAGGRGAVTPYEKVAFLTRVQKNYEAMADAERGLFVRIDASAAPDVVASQATAAVRSALLA